MNLKPSENSATYSPAALAVSHRNGAHLAEIDPQGVQRATPHHGAVAHRNNKLLHRFVELNPLLAEQNVLLNEWVNQRQNLGNVRGARTSHQNVIRCHTVKASWCPSPVRATWW